MTTILVIDDEPDVLLAFLNRAFRDTPVTVEVARTGAEGVRLAAAVRPSAILLDVQLPDTTGLEVFARLKGIDARCPVVFITGGAATETAIAAMQQGAYDYLFKPPDVQQLRKVLGEAVEVYRLAQAPVTPALTMPADARADAIVGRCTAMREVYKEVGRVAGQDVTVLVTGESGTGKELVARAVYQYSRRSDKPFLAINCAAIPDTLLESELFGHEKGAFTSADRRRIGKFEQVSGGTLFLDEIGEISLLTQAKMLRVLQDQTFERVGGNETVKTDVRLIAATNRNLEEMAAGGRFRSDLFYRLNVFTIHLPPLRERGEDLPLLVQHYLRRLGPEFGKDVREVAPEVLEVLRAYQWPGNIRELQSVIKQSLLRATGSVLIPAFLPPGVFAAARPPSRPEAETGAELADFVRRRIADGSREVHKEATEWTDRVVLPLVLTHTNGNQAQAAELLGVTRRTLRNRLRELGLTIQRLVSEDEGD